MALVHRSRGAGLVYGLGGYGGGDGLSFLGDYATYAAQGWSEEEIQRQLATDAARETWNPGFAASPFDGWTEAEKVAYAAGQNASGLVGIGYTAGPDGYDESKYQQALAIYKQNNAGLIASVTQRYNDFINATHAANVAATDYVALAGGDVGAWFALTNPGQSRYSIINGVRVDNAVMQYFAAKAGGQNVSSLAASADAARLVMNASAQPAPLAPISQSFFGPVLPAAPTSATVTASQPVGGSSTYNYTAPSGSGSGALMAVNAPGAMPALMPSGNGGGLDGGGGIDGGGFAGGFGTLAASVPGGWLGILALVGAVVVAGQSKKRRRRR